MGVKNVVPLSKEDKEICIIRTISYRAEISSKVLGSY